MPDESAAEPTFPPVPIVQVGDLVLRQPAKDVTDEHRLFLPELVERMTVTMRAAPGVGLAAPQIGIGLRLAVIEDRSDYINAMPEGKADLPERSPLPLTVLINPNYEPIGERRVSHFEGCLSLEGFRALVPRFHSVNARWTDLEGKANEQAFSGWAARIVQHEIDHLGGKLYIDGMESRTFTGPEAWRETWAWRDVPEVLTALGLTGG